MHNKILQNSNELQNSYIKTKYNYLCTLKIYYLDNHATRSFWFLWNSFWTFYTAFVPLKEKVWSVINFVNLNSQDYRFLYLGL